MATPSAPPARLVTDAPPSYLQAAGEQMVHQEPVPPPYNPSAPYRFVNAVEEFFLSAEHVPDENRVGTMPRRNTAYTRVGAEVEEESPPVRRSRAREATLNFANTLAMRGNRPNRRRRKRTSSPSRQEVIDSLPTFWPICTVLLTVVQIAMFVAVCIYYHLAPISFSPEREFSDECLPEFGKSNLNCSSSTVESREVAPNFFIGPPSSALVHVGAQYTPCMRDNVEFRINAAKLLNREQNLRCCHANGCGRDGACGMLTLDSCIPPGEQCNEILGGASVCRNESVDPTSCTSVSIHPCCIGILGVCVLTSQENCSFYEGYFHPDKAVCSDIGERCFDDICSFEWSPKLNRAQWIRFVFAIFLHKGVVDLLILMLSQIYICGRIERKIGWLRVILIYLISGVGGFLLSGIFIPETVSVGSSGAIFGLLGVQLVELLQGWKWVKKPCLELLKLLIFDAILLILGTLPYIDNFANIGGFIFGVLSAFVFVPYITVGKWDRVKKVCLISIALPLMIVLFFVGFVIFARLPNLDFCGPYCTYINCIPYTSTFCDDFIGNLKNIVPTVPI